MFEILTKPIFTNTVNSCCASSDSAAQQSAPTSSIPEESATSPKVIPSKSEKPSQLPAPSSEPEKMSPGDEKPSYMPSGAKGAKSFLPATAESAHTDVSQPAPVPTSQSKGPKAVRGWAPPTKEWDKDKEKKKTDQTRIEVKEEWDEDGNLVRTTIKKTVTPDWKWKTEKSTEIIPAAEAAKMKKK